MVGRMSVVAMEVPSCAQREARSYLEDLKESPILLEDFDDAAGADGSATLADGEAQAFGHGDRLDQLDLHLGVVARHGHLGPLRQAHLTGDIGGPEVELGPIVVEERGVAAA